VHLHDHNNDFFSKEPYISAREPYVSGKESCISANMPFLKISENIQKKISENIKKKISENIEKKGNCTTQIDLNK